MKKRSMLKNEDGSIMVIGMLMLVMLTLIGVSATTTSNIESQISSNERQYKRDFFRAEAAAMRTLQLLEEADKAQMKDRSFSLPWLAQQDNDIDMSDPDDWSSDGENANAVKEDIVDEDGTIVYSAMNAAVEEGKAEGTSHDMTAESQMWKYSAFGHCESGNERIIVQMGYLRRL